MSAILDAPPEAASVRSPSARLRTTMAAVRLSFTWFGVRKTLTPAQKAQAAESFGAEGDFLSAGKKLVDTRHPAFRAVTAIRGRVQSVWRGMTLPYPEPGIRLLRRDQIERFDVQMADLRGELNDEVANLEAHFTEMKATVRSANASPANAVSCGPHSTDSWSIGRAGESFATRPERRDESRHLSWRRGALHL